MNWEEALKPLLIETAKSLKGKDRRLFMARTVKELGPGGQSLAERELGWNRETIRKGTHELESGLTCVEGYSLRGRKPIETRLPHLLEDLREIVDGQSQADPKFQSHRIYSRLSAPEIRRQLLKKGYTDEDLPTPTTIGTKLRQLGYSLKKVKKTQPLKKIEETDAIFDEIHEVNARADASPTVLRISIDAKATVKVGPFSRGGKSRAEVLAADHDFGSPASVTPVGILLPEPGELYLYAVTSKVTSDCLADQTEAFWESQKHRFTSVEAIVIDLDNGPECHSRRTQFMFRMAQFSHQTGLTITLAYYPPYHSKYNPIERCWGILEQHWNGSLLDSVETVLAFARTMTWKGKHPVVQLVQTVYPTGVKLTQKAMKHLETQVHRHPLLGKWFVDLSFPFVPTLCPS